MQRDGFFFSFMKANSSAPIFMWSICLITCKHSTQDHLSSQIQLIFLLFSPSLFLFLFFHRLKQWGIFNRSLSPLRLIRNIIVLLFDLWYYISYTPVGKGYLKYGIFLFHLVMFEFTEAFTHEKRR